MLLLQEFKLEHLIAMIFLPAIGGEHRSISVHIFNRPLYHMIYDTVQAVSAVGIGRGAALDGKMCIRDRCYVPERKLNVQAYFFAAADETAANFPVWDQYCEKPMRVYKMKGNNFSILQYPDVLDFAEQLNTVLSCEGV